MHPFDGQWMNGNFRVIAVVIDVAEAVCFPVGSPIGSNTFHGPRGGEVIRIGEIVWHTVIVGMSGVDNTSIGDIEGVCSSQVVATASMNDKVSVRWVVWGRGFSGNLVEREVLKNHGVLNGQQALKDLNG